MGISTRVPAGLVARIVVGRFVSAIFSVRAAETGFQDDTAHLQCDLERFLKPLPLQQVSYGTGHRVHPLCLSRAKVPDVIEALLDILATPQAQGHHSLFAETNANFIISSPSAAGLVIQETD